MLTLYPGIQYTLPRQILGPDYLRWLDQMHARPSEEIWERRPCDDGTMALTEEGWRFQMELSASWVSGDGSRGQLWISLPMEGELWQEYREQVTTHLHLRPLLTRVTRLSDTVSPRMSITNPKSTLHLDRQVDVLELGAHGEVETTHPLWCLIVKRVWVYGEYRAAGVLESVVADRGTLRAPVIMARSANVQLGGRYQCQHLVIWNAEPGILQRLEDCQCQRITLCDAAGPEQSYRPTADGWEPVDEEDPLPSAAWVADPEAASQLPTDLLVTEAPVSLPGYVSVYEEEVPGLPYYIYRRLTAKSARSLVE